MAKSKPHIERIVQAGICIALALLVIIITEESLFRPAFIEELEQSHLDERFNSRGPVIPGDTSVVIVAITDYTHNGIPHPYNNWPWPRNYFAKVIENLNEAGALAVGLDITMFDPDQFDPANDSALVNVIHKYGNVVVAGKLQSDSRVSVKKRDENFRNIFFTADSSIGIVNVPSDNDGVHRRYMPAFYSVSLERRVPSFGFGVLNKVYGLPPFYIPERVDGAMLYHDKRIPSFFKYTYLINFYGHHKTFPHFDFLNVLDDGGFKTTEELEYEVDINAWDDPYAGLKNDDVFRGKIVLIGSTREEDSDIVPIPISKGEYRGDNTIFGVEFHANAIQTVIDNNFIAAMSRPVEYILIIALSFLGFFISSALKRIKLKSGLLIEAMSFVMVAVLFFFMWWLSIQLFTHSNYLFSLVPAEMSLVLGYFGSTAYHFLAERKQKSMIKGMFAQYVNTAVVEQLIEDPDKMALGGTKKELTVFFSDIAGFSSFSEGFDAEELVTFLNEYLSEMTRLVIENKGTLDKYIGDAIMAFWGAPVPNEQHAVFACRTALLMQKRLTKMREVWKARGLPQIAMRVGIHTGDMVAGNVGGVERFDYTVIGDNVNIGSRLEGANKQYGTHIMISENTYEFVKDEFFLRELDCIIVKGRTKPVTVYELIAFNDEKLPTNVLDGIEHFSRGLNSYKRRQFTEASEHFMHAFKANKADGPSLVYYERCKFYIDNPPPEDWDGVFKMKAK